MPFLPDQPRTLAVVHSQVADQVDQPQAVDQVKQPDIEELHLELEQGFGPRHQLSRHSNQVVLADKHSGQVVVVAGNHSTGDNLPKVRLAGAGHSVHNTMVLLHFKPDYKLKTC